MLRRSYLPCRLGAVTPHLTEGETEAQHGESHTGKLQSGLVASSTGLGLQHTVSFSLHKGEANLLPPEPSNGQ